MTSFISPSRRLLLHGSNHKTSTLVRGLSTYNQSNIHRHDSSAPMLKNFKGILDDHHNISSHQLRSDSISWCQFSSETKNKGALDEESDSEGSESDGLDEVCF